MTLWAARVESGLAPEVWEFLRAEDAELLPYDCEATLLHARRLEAAGLISAEELADAESTLAHVREQGAGLLATEDEDVHSGLERLLGTVGRKIHGGRSRNDQVAAALRLYVEDACREAAAAIERLAGAVLEQAERRRRRRCRLHPPSAGPARHRRPPPARLG